MIGLHHCVALIKMIEMHMWNAQFQDWIRELQPLEAFLNDKAR